MGFVFIVGSALIFIGLINCFKIDNALAFSGITVGSLMCVMAYAGLKEIKQPIIRPVVIAKQSRHRYIKAKKSIKYIAFFCGIVIFLVLAVMIFNQTITILKGLLRF